MQESWRMIPQDYVKTAKSKNKGWLKTFAQYCVHGMLWWLGFGFFFRSGEDRREKSRKDRPRGREGKGRRKGGYCECCIVKYDNLKAVSTVHIPVQMCKNLLSKISLHLSFMVALNSGLSYLQHLQSEQHQAFSKSEEYLVVDRVISGLSCDFINFSPEIKR